MSRAFISAIGEKGLIQRIKKRVRQGRGVVCGIGDDCAVLEGKPGWYQLFASDMLVEGVHFPRVSPSQARAPRRLVRLPLAEAIGWKALAVNVSDIAAMGGIPRYAVISLGLPRNMKVSFVDGLYRGLSRCAAKFGVSVVGGDTDRSEKIVIDVAILGEVEPRKIVYRSGAKAGDILFVTGRLGGAVRSGRHLTFTPRLREARALVGKVRPHAMIDLSDGLGPDLIRICEASRAAAQIDAGSIPRRSGVTLNRALTEGEDFELLMSVSPRDARKLEVWGRRNLSCGLTRIGRIVRRRGKNLVTFSGPFGQRTPQRHPSLAGFQHF